jgi:hypothetical protein
MDMHDLIYCVARGERVIISLGKSWHVHVRHSRLVPLASCTASLVTLDANEKLFAKTVLTSKS